MGYLNISDLLAATTHANLVEWYAHREAAFERWDSTTNGGKDGGDFIDPWGK